MELHLGAATVLSSRRNPHSPLTLPSDASWRSNYTLTGVLASSDTNVFNVKDCEITALIQRPFSY